MTEEEILQLQKENQDLREALKQTQELPRVALARIDELEKQKTPPPAFVKANTKKVPKDYTNTVGFTSYAMAMSSKRNIPTMNPSLLGWPR